MTTRESLLSETLINWTCTYKVFPFHQTCVSS